MTSFKSRGRSKRTSFGSRDDDVYGLETKASKKLGPKAIGRAVGMAVGGYFGGYQGMKYGGKGGAQVGSIVETGEVFDPDKAQKESTSYDPYEDMPLQDMGESQSAQEMMGQGEKDESQNPMAGQSGGQLDSVISMMGNVDKFRGMYEKFAGGGGGSGTGASFSSGGGAAGAAGAAGGG